MIAVETGGYLLGLQRFLASMATLLKQVIVYGEAATVSAESPLSRRAGKFLQVVHKSFAYTTRHIQLRRVELPGASHRKGHSITPDLN